MQLNSILLEPVVILGVGALLGIAIGFLLYRLWSRGVYENALHRLDKDAVELIRKFAEQHETYVKDLDAAYSQIADGLSKINGVKSSIKGTTIELEILDRLNKMPKPPLLTRDDRMSWPQRSSLDHVSALGQEPAS